ncbi:MAG TPA: hypothetical protein VNU64_01540 [Burkholderiales bacterium]|nr:hypothetical protein [Burkholderiales bacterium]
MLQKEGIDASARMMGNELIVFMAYPVAGGTPWTRKFPRHDMQRAADAVAAAAITFYPSCSLAKVAEFLSSALGLTARRV